MVNNLENLMIRNRLSKINFSRKLLKKPVMTIPYNVSFDSIVKQLESEGFFTCPSHAFVARGEGEALDYDTLNNHKEIIRYIIVNSFIVKNGESLVLNNKEYFILTQILYTAIFERIPTLKVFIKYLNELITLISIIDKPLFWITPSGMKIYISYNLRVIKETKNLYNPKKRSVSIYLLLN
jgi:hypothetical protein